MAIEDVVPGNGRRSFGPGETTCIAKARNRRFLGARGWISRLFEERHCPHLRKLGLRMRARTQVQPANNLFTVLLEKLLCFSDD